MWISISLRLSKDIPKMNRKVSESTSKDTELYEITFEYVLNPSKMFSTLAVAIIIGPRIPSFSL